MQFEYLKKMKIYLKYHKYHVIKKTYSQKRVKNAWNYL